MKRAMCIYLPQWPLQHLRHLRPELQNKPAALIEHQANGARVLLCCERATRAGVRPGMPLAEALAIERELFVWDKEPVRDRQALERLALWAQRYSPIVG